METIVKYRFDREMVAFVKTLEIKTSMFGYDKSDVYDKIKDLLVKARDVCEELVREAYEELGVTKTASGDPAGLQAPVTGEAAESTPLVEAAPDESGEGEEPEVIRLRQENKELREHLEEFSRREELLLRAHDIVSEARLERESIIRNAQKKAEEELFLFRARQREEENVSRKELERLHEQRTEIKRVCDNYRAYAEEGQSLFSQVQAYIDKLDQLEEQANFELSADPSEAPGTAVDPPLLSPDESLSCTEESMPLCEMVDEDPDGIFRGQDPDDDPSAYENEPDELDQSAECPYLD